jgi:hypothetical protein
MRGRYHWLVAVVLDRHTCTGVVKGSGRADASIQLTRLVHLLELGDYVFRSRIQ